MDITLSLQNALTGLQAAQANLAIISSNITNAQTPGYSRETVPLSTQIVGNAGAGVLVGVTQRQVDENLAKSARQQDTAASAATTTNSYFQQIQSLFGQVNSGDSLGDVLNKFSSALQTLSTSPEDAIAQQSVVAAAESLAAKLNSTSAGIQQIRSGADNQIATDVQTLNTQLQNIARYNAAITHDRATGQSTAALEDQRDQALDQIAKLMGVQDFVRPDGTMVVLTTTGKVLVDSNAQTLSYTPSGTVSAGTVLSPLKVGNIDITSDTTTGEIGALLSLRDTQLPNLTAELNQFTNNLFSATQNANLATTNSGLGATNDANHFFASVDLTNGVDNAATIQVHPDLVGNPSLLDGPSANPDPSISQALSDAINAPLAFAAAGNFATGTTVTLSNYTGQILGQSASAAAAAADNSKFQSSLQTTFAARASSVSGVNVDQELAELTVFQNMYAASAHVLSAVDNMLNTLLQIQ
jgi:flagellar hook-associated protein 1 FlgK